MTLQDVSRNAAAHTDSPNTPYFVGAYVADMTNVAIASVFAGVHASFQSAPGWGKTAILSAAAAAIAGEDHTNRIDLSPASSPALITGLDDPKVLINEGRFVKVTTGTPFDPNMKIVILDEFFRGNDAAFDAALHALDPMKQSGAIVWGTNNFIPTGERQAALLDRIALWYWLPAQAVNVAAVASSLLLSEGSPQVPGYLPDWDQVMAVRAARPGQKAVDTVTSYLETLIAEAINEGFGVGHPRSVAHMSKVLYRVAAAYNGAEDFTNLPPQAIKAMRYCYPAANYAEAVKWASFINTLTDRVAAEIDRVLSENVVEFKRVAAITDASQRNAASIALGQNLANAQATLAQQFGMADPRISEAVQTITKWYASALAGNEKGISLNS